MSLKCTFIENNGVLIHAAGLLTGEELINHKNALYTESNNRKQIGFQLCDFSNVEKVEITAEEVNHLAELDKQACFENPDMLIAIVAGSDLMYGLGRMWQTLVDDSSFEAGVFRSLDEANIWIDRYVAKIAV